MKTLQRIFCAANIVGGLFMLGVSPLADTALLAAMFAVGGACFVAQGVSQWREG